MVRTKPLLFTLLAITALVSGCITIVVQDSDDSDATSGESQDASPQQGGSLNEPTQSDQQSGPSLSLTTSGTSTDQWSIRVTSATQALPVSEYTLILTAPSGTYSSRLDSWNEGGYSVDLPMGGATVGVGERIQISGGFQGGTYTAELLHIPTGSSAGSISRSF